MISEGQQHQYEEGEFDNILENRIKFGKYQIISTAATYLSMSLYGAQIVLFTIILPIIIKQWGLTNTQKIILSQSLFVGVFIGSLIGGYLGDKFGRRYTLRLGIIICCIFGYASAISQNYYHFLILRFLTSIGIGLNLSNASTHLSETFLYRQRKVVQVIINGFFVFASIALSIFSILIISKKKNSWRILSVAGNSITLICLILSYFQKESIKFYLDNKRFDEAFDNIDKAIILNDNNNDILSEQEKQQMIYYYTYTNTKNENNGYQEIFNRKYRHNVIFVSSQWFFCFLLYFTIIFTIPLRLSLLKRKQLFNQQTMILLSNFGEVFGIIFAILILNLKQIKQQHYFKIFYLGFIFCMIMSILLPHYDIYFLLFSRLFVCVLTNLLYVLTDNRFPSYIKSRCFGFVNIWGSIGSIIMPLVIFYLQQLGYQTFLIFLIIIGIIAAIFEMQINYTQDLDHQIVVYDKFDDEKK